MPIPRLYVDVPLAAGAELALPPPAARHVQVLRLQPGAPLTLFDGRGGEWRAEVRAIGRRDVAAAVLGFADVERELRRAVTLAIGMPANERMDALVEKATELGAAAIQPLHCERSVLRLTGERGERRRAHWRAIAAAACEQCGRNRLPTIAAPLALAAWLASLDADDALKLLLSAPAATLGEAAAAAQDAGIDSRGAAASDGRAPPEVAHLARYLADRPVGRITLLSGPEGGFSADEMALATARGFQAATLGERVLRADTAPLAALAVVAALAER
jgi:16S rRNA (uracil1498-N3)-methyltransferase